MQKHTIESLTELVKTLRIERNNFKAMYENAKDRKEIKRLQKKVEELQKDLVLRDEVICLLQEQIENFKLRIDELERMVFGKHKRKDKDPPTGSGSSGAGASGAGGSGDSEGGKPENESGDSHTPPKKRPPFSYRRKTPEEQDITEDILHPLSNCPDCSHDLTKRKIVTRFTEDIPSLEEIQKLLHRITRHSIETGYCPCCQKRKIAIPIAKQMVSIGENTRRFVCYASVIQNQTYSQIEQFLSDMVGITLSDGEIADIFSSEKMKMLPEYVAIKDRLEREAVVHYDESPWYVSKEEQGNYGWFKTGIHKISEMLFLLGRSRGKGNALELRGKPNGTIIGGQIAVTDDYGAYKNIFERHQLCWAHPHRKFRDLKDSPSLTKEQVPACTKMYTGFASLYKELNALLLEENNHHASTGIWRTERMKKKELKLRKIFRSIAIVHPKDPKKLQTLKTSLGKNEEYYFTCMSGPGIPSDNNKAERGLRHLVLKRRMCHGSKTQKGADVFSVLASVLLSLKAKYPTTLLSEYHKLMERLA